MSGRRLLARTVRAGVPVLVGLVTVACFAPALRNGFVDYDDDVVLTANPRFRGLSLAHLRWMLASSVGGHWQPLTWLSFALDHAVWGMEPAGYHLTSVLLHAANAVAAYLLFAALLERAILAPQAPGALRISAAFGALVWALHPLRVESVAWATERRDVLSGLFFLLAVLTYLRAHPAGARASGRWLAISIACATASLLAKAWAMTLPALLLVVDAYPLGRWRTAEWRRCVIEKVPYAVLALGAGVMAQRAQAGMPTAIGEHPLPARLAQAAVGLCVYLWKSVAPSGLQPLYELRLPFDPAAPSHVAALLAVAGISVALIALRRRFPAGLAAWAASIVIVSPVLGLAQVGPQLAADRYTYLAALPAASVLAGGAYRCLAARTAVALRAGVAAAGVAVLVVLGLRTRAQIGVWRDTLTLWRHAVAVEPDNASVRHRLVAALLQAGQGDEAVRQIVALRAIAERRAADRTARTQLAYATGRLALALAASGQSEQAIGLLAEAQALTPDDPLIATNLGYVELQAGRVDEAVATWQGVLARDPTNLAARAALGGVLLRLGRLAEAETALLIALAQDPGDANTLTNLGTVRWRQGRRDDATALWEQALALDPDHALARRSLDSARAAAP